MMDCEREARNFVGDRGDKSRSWGASEPVAHRGRGEGRGGITI